MRGSLLAVTSMSGRLANVESRRRRDRGFSRRPNYENAAGSCSVDRPSANSATMTGSKFGSASRLALQAAKPNEDKLRRQTSVCGTSLRTPVGLRDTGKVHTPAVETRRRHHIHEVIKQNVEVGSELNTDARRASLGRHLPTHAAGGMGRGQKLQLASKRKGRGVVLAHTAGGKTRLATEEIMSARTLTLPTKRLSFGALSAPQRCTASRTLGPAVETIRVISKPCASKRSRYSFSVRLRPPLRTII